MSAKCHTSCILSRLMIHHHSDAKMTFWSVLCELFSLCLQMVIKAIHSSTRTACQSWGSQSLCYCHFSASCSLWPTSSSFWKRLGLAWACVTGAPRATAHQRHSSVQLSSCFWETTWEKKLVLEISCASSHQGSALRHSSFLKGRS